MNLNRFLPVFLAAAFAMTLVAGCLTSPSAAYHVYASKGSFATGWDYDGKSTLPFDGHAFIDVDNAANTGAFLARGKVAGTEYQIYFEDFKQQPNKTFQDGGVRANLIEHGDSGTGDKSIPKSDLEMAGWGFATVKILGKLYKDPITGKDQWAAHFMVLRNGVRDNATGAIWADEKKTKAYNPADPHNGTHVDGDYEVHLVLRNQTGNASQPTTITPITYSMANPQLAMSHNLVDNSLLGAKVHLDLTVAGTGVDASNVNFTVKDPAGNVVLAKTLGAGGMVPVSQAATATGQLEFTASQIGQYTVATSGRVAPGGSYSIKGTVTAPPQVVLNFWWEDLIFGEAAETAASGDKLMEGSRLHQTHGNATAAA